MIRTLSATLATILLLLASTAEAHFWHHHGYAYPVYGSAVYPGMVVAGGQAVIAGQSVFAGQSVIGGQSVMVGQSVVSPFTTYAAPQSLVLSSSAVNASAVTPDQILTLLGLVSKLIPDRQADNGGGGGGGSELSISGSHGSGTNANIEGRLNKLEQSMGAVLKKLNMNCDKLNSGGAASGGSASGGNSSGGVNSSVGAVGPNGQPLNKPFTASAAGATGDCEELATPKPASDSAAEPSIATLLKSVEQMKGQISAMDTSVKGKLKKLQDDSAALDELKKQLGIAAPK